MTETFTSSVFLNTFRIVSNTSEVTNIGFDFNLILFFLFFEFGMSLYILFFPLRELNIKIFRLELLITLLVSSFYLLQVVNSVFQFLIFYLAGFYSLVFSEDFFNIQLLLSGGFKFFLDISFLISIFFIFIGIMDFLLVNSVHKLNKESESFSKGQINIFEVIITIFYEGFLLFFLIMSFIYFELLLNNLWVFEIYSFNFSNNVINFSRFVFFAFIAVYYLVRINNYVNDYHLNFRKILILLPIDYRHEILLDNKKDVTKMKILVCLALISILFAFFTIFQFNSLKYSIYYTDPISVVLVPFFFGFIVFLIFRLKITEVFDKYFEVVRRFDVPGILIFLIMIFASFFTVYNPINTVSNDSAQNHLTAEYNQELITNTTLFGTITFKSPDIFDLNLNFHIFLNVIIVYEEISNSQINISSYYNISQIKYFDFISNDQLLYINSSDLDSYLLDDRNLSLEMNKPYKIEIQSDMNLNPLNSINQKIGLGYRNPVNEFKLLVI